MRKDAVVPTIRFWKAKSSKVKFWWRAILTPLRERASLALRPTRVKHHKPTHECGVFAVFGHPNAAELTYFGLFALQHRGQESAGIVTADGPNTPFNRPQWIWAWFHRYFPPSDLEKLKGTRAIGHVRYSTTGSSTLLNAQPLMFSTAGAAQIAIGAQWQPR